MGTPSGFSPSWFTSRPLRFFGMLGGILMLIGSILGALILIRGLGPPGGAGRVILVSGLFLLVLGIQTIAIGLIGEIMTFFLAPTHARYRVIDRVN
jgi:hypothetical protein